jgi:hypothetical protein
LLTNFSSPSENLSPDQVRTLFSAVKLLRADNAHPPQKFADVGNTVPPSVIFNFSFLKRLFLHTFGHSCTFLANHPKLQIADNPQKKPCKKVLAGKALAGLKLNSDNVPIVVEKCIAFIVRYGEARAENWLRLSPVCSDCFQVYALKEFIGSTETPTMSTS